MIDSVAEALTRPGAFFARLQEDERAAQWGVWLVLLVSVLGAVVAYFSALPTAEAFSGSPLGQIGLMAAPVAAFVFSFAAWLVYGLLVRMSAGINVKPWAVVAYSLAPQLILLSLTLVVAALFPVDIAPVAADLGDPEQLQRLSAQVQREVSASVYGRASLALSYLGAFWSLALIFVGVRAGTDTGRAVLSTLLVATLSLGTLLVPYLLSSA